MATPSTLTLPYSSQIATSTADSVSYTLVGRSMNRISFRRYNSAADGSPAIAANDTTSSVNTRAQASIDIRTQVKAPGALGNDRIRISLKDTFLASDGLYKTDSCELSFSFARDPNSTAVRRKALINQLLHLIGLDDVTTTWTYTNNNATKTAASNARISPINVIRLNLDMKESVNPST